MRTLLILALGAGVLTAGAADAQRVVTHGPGASYPAPGHGPMVRPMPQGPIAHPMPHAPIIRPMPQAPHARPPMVRPGTRWGSQVGGRWWGGANAPGGWKAYRRPVRGYVLPQYWVAPRFFVNDWQSYGLVQPPVGYNWVRYYDDAVLIDGRGSVYDTMDGVDWDGGYADGYAEDVVTDGRNYDERGYARPDNGLGGAAVGAVVGGVAGNVIAGRGNRLGGTLIGAGVGAAAGYAIDKNEDRGRRAPPPPPRDHGAGYPPPPHGGYPAPMPYPAVPGGPSWVSPDGRTTVVTSTGGGYYGGTTTTVVVQSAPVVTTTTTTEVIEDAVTYTRTPARRSVKRVWRARPRCACR